MPLKISTEDQEKVRRAAFYLKKQQDTGLSVATKLAVQFELKAFDDRIRQLAEAQLLGESPGQVPEAPPLPPVAPRIEQDTVDEYTKIGKAKKVSDAIAQAAKNAGVTDGNLKPSMIRESMKAPEEMVRAAGSWKEVKKRYLDNEGTMRLILQYRIDEVGRIYKQVIDQMWNDNEPKRTAYNKDKSVPKEEVFQLNDLQFAMMGSTDLTSDYDVSFDHNVEKPWVGTTAVKLFNEKFRAKWGKEAGTVFDTNVYTQGFMPSDMSNIPAGVEKSIKGRIDKVTKEIETAGDGSGELAALKTKLELQAKTAAGVREQMAKDAIDGRSKKRVTDRVSQQKVFEIEDLMSLVKIRKFMGTAEWREYSELLLEGLPEGPAREAAASVLERADTTFVMLNKQLRTRMKQLKESGSGADEADLELEASNRLYEEYLEQAGGIVAENKGILQGPAISDWTQKQSSALYFANEAYHTSGPVESTVIGQQMGIAMKQVAEQHLQAINEQTGFVVEQHENAHGNNGRFLWKSAKYVDRICSILGQIKKDIGPTALNDPKHAGVLKPLSANLLTIKKGNETDAQKDEMSLMVLDSAGGGDVRQMVVELNADVNQQLRVVKPKVSAE
jgi:hypothetical protein